MSDRAVPAAQDLVAQEVAAHCLVGMARAADVLVGDEVQRVCETFGIWLGEARRIWPWLPGLCFDALEPVGVSFPAQDPSAVVLGRLLVAAETDALAVRAALDEVGEPRSVASGVRGVGLLADAAVALRARRLIAAVDGFWAELVRGTKAAHEPVVGRDRAAADRVITQTRRRLEDIAEEIAWLATTVASAVAPSRPVSGDSAPAAPAPAVAGRAAPAPAVPPLAGPTPAVPVPAVPVAAPAPPIAPSGPVGASAVPPAPSDDGDGATTTLDQTEDIAATGPLPPPSAPAATRSPRPSQTPPRRRGASPAPAGRRGASVTARTGSVPSRPSPLQRRAEADTFRKERTWEPVLFLVLAVAAAVAVLVRVGGL